MAAPHGRRLHDALARDADDRHVVAQPLQKPGRLDDAGMLDRRDDQVAAGRAGIRGGAGP